MATHKSDPKKDHPKKKSTPAKKKQHASHSKKGKAIKPLHEKELKKQLKDDAKERQANAEQLAELAKKTAELAEQVGGEDAPSKKVLDTSTGESKKQADATEHQFVEMPPAETVKPDNHPKKKPGEDETVDLIRSKLDKIYSEHEPDAAEEAAEAVSVEDRSTHQDFMYALATSGKPLAQIQTEWHEYYIALPDEEKHKVWEEFYSKQHEISANAKHIEDKSKDTSSDKPKRMPVPAKIPINKQSVADTKKQIMNKVSADGRLTPWQHIKSLMFGLGLATFVAVFVAAVFFNQIFIAPFISPSTTVSATPIISASPDDIGPESKIIIPKINVDVPVVYDLNTVQEDAIQDALEDGVVHYATSPEPGEIGNSVIVGHSSNNILNSGKYKFAFVLLRRLEVNDTFYVHKDGVRYTYKIFEKKVVPPTDVSVLGESTKPNTMTLITCDPPGTSINRLIIVGEQISPDPAGNTEATIEVEDDSEAELPSNAPSLWSRLWPF